MADLYGNADHAKCDVELPENFKARMAVKVVEQGKWKGGWSWIHESKWPSGGERGDVDL